MPRIPVYATPCSASRRDHRSAQVVSRRPIQVPTFRPTSHAQPIGTIVAPDPAALHQRPGHMPKLKVPKPGRAGEFWLMGANEAAEAAVEGKYGLAWESTTPAAGLSAATVAIDEWEHGEAAS